MYRSRPRIRTRHLKKRCSQCKEGAQRFKDIGPTRTWYCAPHFKEIENGNSKESIIGD
jgi:hypothetical protein